jgi:hypothetical protein
VDRRRDRQRSRAGPLDVVDDLRERLVRHREEESS